MQDATIDHELVYTRDESLCLETLKTWHTRVALGQVYGLPKAIRLRLQAVAVETLLLCAGDEDELSRELREELKRLWSREVQPWFEEHIADALQEGRTRRQCVREAILILLYTCQDGDRRRLRQLLLNAPVGAPEPLVSA